MKKSKEHTFEDTLAELQRHADARRDAELREVEFLVAVEHVEKILTPDQLKTWRMVEEVIDGSIAKTNPDCYIDAKEVREYLKDTKNW